MIYRVTIKGETATVEASCPRLALVAFGQEHWIDEIDLYCDVEDVVIEWFDELGEGWKVVQP